MGFSCCAMSSLVKLMKIAQTPSGSNRVFHRSPEAFHGIEMMGISWHGKTDLKKNQLPLHICGVDPTFL
jgi:hypothetical protein